MSGRRRRQPRSHWVLAIVLLMIVGSLLVVSAYTGGELGEGTATPQVRPGDAGVPAAVRAGGPIVDASRPGSAGVHPPAGSVVLTFDDGPSSWTPQILEVLERHRVPATFFVIGSHVTARPRLLRRMITDGDEIGVHTFTHPDLGGVPAWRERLELDQTPATDPPASCDHDFATTDPGPHASDELLAAQPRVRQSSSWSRPQATACV